MISPLMLSSGWRVSTSEQSLESAPEVDVENGVDDGIKSWVDVTQPDDEVDENRVGRVCACLAERKYDVHEKKWQPADDKGGHDDRHCSGDSAFLRLRHTLLLLPEFSDFRPAAGGLEHFRIRLQTADALPDPEPQEAGRVASESFHRRRISAARRRQRLETRHDC